MSWYVLITKPNSEKKVAGDLKKMNIEAYCPTRIEHRQWSDRIKKVEVPLLPSMVLVNLPEQERASVFQSPGALRYLFWMNKPAKVSQEEVDALKGIKTDQISALDILQLKEGEEIELENLGSSIQKGIIKQISGNQCWIILKSLGYVVKFNI